MLTNSDCRIRPMGGDDLERVLAWRNHPDVRFRMLAQEEILADEHRKWFEFASRDEARRLLIVEENGVAFGYVSFSYLGQPDTAEWGFYVAPGAPKGSGRKLGDAALNYAFRDLDLHKVFGQVLDSNAASIKFHHAMGFRQEGVLRAHRRIGNNYHDLILFGLLRHEWISSDMAERTVSQP